MTDASDNGTSRLDRIEAALETVATSMQSMATNTAIGFETLTNMTRVLDARMVVLEAQMAEVLGRLRIIGENLAIHEHPHDHGGQAA